MAAGGACGVKGDLASGRDSGKPARADGPSRDGQSAHPAEDGAPPYAKAAASAISIIAPNDRSRSEAGSASRVSRWSEMVSTASPRTP